MSSINQLADEGSVIGYRPNLQYNKELNGQGKVNSSQNGQNSSQNTDKTGKISYSSAVSALAEFNPSATIQKLESSTSILTSFIDKLTEAFKRGKWNEYDDISMLLTSIESGNTEFSEDFVKYHSSNPNGSIIPELIMEIQDSKIRVQELIKTLKELFYGQDSITADEAAEKDSARLKQLKTYEELGQTEKNNYLAVAMDAFLCKNISIYSYGVNKKASKLAKIGTGKADSFATDTDRSIVAGLYDEINQEIANRKQTYEVQNSAFVVQQALYNYYRKRKEAIQLCCLFTDSSESAIIGNRLVKKQQELDEAVANITRALKANEQYMSKLAELESEKSFLMNVYQRFSYNLDNV